MDNQQFRPTLLDVPISFFEHDYQRGGFTNVPSQELTLRHITSSSRYRSTIEAIRSEPDKASQERLKRQLPAITPVAWLHHRKKGTSFDDRIRQQWPLIMGDVDKKDNLGVNMAELKMHLARLPYVLLCAYSVRGGLWFVIRLPDGQTPDTLAAHFRHLQKLFSEVFGVNLDKTKGGNPTDLRFVSYDTDPYLNDSPTVMGKTYTPPKPQLKSPMPVSFDFRHFLGQNDANLLKGLVRYTESAGVGQRHSTLLKAASLAGRYVAAGRLDEHTAVCALETVVSEWPMFSKSQKTIQDGIRYGLTNPLYADEVCQRTHSITSEKRAPRIVRTLAEWAANPGSICKPDESQLERL